MHLSHSVHVDRPAAAVFAALRDVDRATRCLPGARQVAGAADGVTGAFDVRVGRLRLAYSGRVRLLSVDEAGRCLTVRARGREQHGNGDADAYVTTRVRADDGGAVLDVDADLDVRGRAAVFGQGTLGGVGTGIVTGFAEALVQDLSPAAEPVREEPARPATTRTEAATVRRRAGTVVAAAAAATAVGLGVRALLRHRLRLRGGRRPRH